MHLVPVPGKKQSEDGRWYQVVNRGDDPTNWLENSCSCLYVAALCVLSIENPQNRKENSPLSDREIPIIRKKHVESFRFFPYLVGKKAAFTAFCPIG